MDVLAVIQRTPHIVLYASRFARVDEVLPLLNLVHPGCVVVKAVGREKSPDFDRKNMSPRGIKNVVERTIWL